MFKRTKGYWLLTMLVLTGLAGKINSHTLSGKERRTLVRELKTSREAFTESIENLSEKQLNFRHPKNRITIKECIYQLAAIENDLWTTAKECLKNQPLNPRRSFTDEELLFCIGHQPPLLSAKPGKFKNVEDAIKFYKKNNDEIVKYVNTSTGNIRAHTVHTVIGNTDAYQLLLLNAVYTKYYTAKINELKSSQNFSK